MRTNIKPENRRLLESLDYLDESVISSVLAEIKVPDEGRPERAKNTVGRSIKYALALAACLVLLSAVIPVVSYLVGMVDFYPGGNPIASTTEASKVVRMGYQVWGDEIYFSDRGHLTRYLPQNSELYDLSGKSEGMPVRVLECLSQIADGKLYYIYEDAVSISERGRYAAVLDLETMQSTDLCDLSNYLTSDRAYVYGDYYYFSREDWRENKGELYRIPLEGGSPKLVLEFQDEESLFMVADGELITVNRHTYISISDSTEKTLITAYNIETGAERILWDGAQTSLIGAKDPAYLEGKLYFLAEGDRGYDLIAVEIESGESECLMSGLASYLLMDGGFYYYTFEARQVDYVSPFAAAPAEWTTHESATLRYRSLDGKTDIKVYKNSKIASYYPSEQIIAEGKMLGYFCGSFPKIGISSDCILAEIDLETGKIKKLESAYITRSNDVTEEPKPTEDDISIPDYTPPKTTSVPTYWDFLPDLEPLSREQMTEIREAYAKYTFADQYVKYCKQYIARGENYNVGSAYKNAEDAAVKAMLALFTDDYYYSRYYGTFGDNVVVALVDYTLAATEYKLKDTSIVFPQGAEMYVYRDGEITEFGEFYKSGSMSEEDALRLWYRHQIYESTSRSSFEYQDGAYLEPISGVEPLTRKQISEIRTAYANYVYNTVLDQYTADYIAQYGEEEGRRKVLIKAGDASHATIKSLFGDDLITSRYYGIIDGYVVFGIADSEDSVSLYVYSFDYGMVFKYTSSMLSADGVATLTVRKAEYEAYLINNDATKLLVESYFGQILYDDEHPLVFTHKTDRCMLICIKSGYEELKKYEIAGYEFVFPYGVNLYVGCNGETHSLYVAHQIGYITDADMAQIYEAYLDYLEK